MAYEQPAGVDSAWAGYDDGTLRIRIAGTVPESCWRAQIRQSIIDIFPPQFEAVRFRTRMACLEVITPYVVEEEFALPTPPGESIVLHHAGGKMELAVEPFGTRPDPRPMAEYDEAEGRSKRRFDFEEALEDAIANLPDIPDPILDWLDEIEVVRTYAQVGGLAGSHDLVVRVRRPRLHRDEG